MLDRLSALLAAITLLLVPLVAPTPALAQASVHGCLGIPNSAGAAPAVPCGIAAVDLTVTLASGATTDFGACTGVDDTSALTAWAAAIAAGSVASIPNSTCVFKTPIVFPLGIDGVTVQGAGLQSILDYSGTSTTPTLVTFGSKSQGVGDSGGCATSGWTLTQFRVHSETIMTGGDGLLLGHLCNTEIDKVYVGQGIGNGADSNLYNGIHFWAGNEIHVWGFNYRSSNQAMIANGDLTTYVLADLVLDGGVISHSGIGMVLGGAANISTTNLTMILNGTDVSIDQSQVARTNAGIFFGSNTLFDETQGGAGIDLNITDPGGVINPIQLPPWIAAATNACVVIAGGVTAQITDPGGVIDSCGGDGIQNNSTLTQITISSVYLAFNGAGGSGYGFNNTVVNPHISLTGMGGLGTNQSGDVFGSVISGSSGAGVEIESLTGVGPICQNQTAALSNGNMVCNQINKGFNSTGANNRTWSAFNTLARVATTGSEEAEISIQTYHDGGLQNEFTFDKGAMYLGAFSGPKLIDSAGDILCAGFCRPGQVVFANLATVDPTPQVGDELNITDASTCTSNANVTAGGGSTHSCPVVYNGANWVAQVTH